MAEIRTKKTSAWTLLLLLITVFVLGYIIISATLTEKQQQNKLNILKKDTVKIETEIHNNPMSKRLNDYGYWLNSLNNLVKYKDYKPKWFDMLNVLKNDLAKNLVTSSFGTAADTDKITITLGAPTPERLLSSINAITKMKEFDKADFASIVVSPITFQKVNKNLFSADLSMNISTKYLSKKFDEESNMRLIKQQSETDSWVVSWTWWDNIIEQIENTWSQN